jgi:glycosyl transferase family 87
MALLATAMFLLVAVPTAALIAMGAVTGRPYGQDGGVVQLPLAIDRILSGRSPYGADYSDSMLGRLSRVSDFWTEHGGNPILHHHAYLPGTHLLMMPFVPLARALLGVFDPRIVTTLAFLAAGVLAHRLAGDPARGLAAAAAVWVSPLVYWQQAFGAGDVLQAALLLGCVHLARAARPRSAAALLGLACATKQLAWPFAPFLLAHLSGARSLGELASAPARGRLFRAGAIAAGVFLLVVAPVAALDLRAFWGDVFRYNAGLPGGDNYPLGGTPGLGLANLIVYFGGVSSLRDYVPLGWLYLLLVPIGILLLREQLRRGDATWVLVTGSAALLVSLWVSRVMHPNYLILAAVLLPAAAAAGAAIPIDAVVACLALLAASVEIAEGQVFASTWADAAGARWPPPGGIAAALAPRAGPGLTADPLGLAFSALASLLAIGVLVAGVLRMRRAVRAAILAVAVIVLAAVPTLILTHVGRLSGTPRVQDGWAATVWPGSGGADDARPRLREAWSVSFRKDPPGEPLVGAPAPAASLVAGLLRGIGAHDPRLMSLLALLVSGLLVARFDRGERRLLLASALVLPPILLGVAFGSGESVLLALVLAALWLASRSRALAGGMALGSAGALFPRVLAATPQLVRGPGASWRGLAAVGGLTFLVLCATGAWAAGGLGAPRIGPGLGLSNLRLYAGATAGALDRLGPALAVLVTAVAIGAAAAAAPSGRSRLALAAVGAIATLWLASAASPDDVVVPIVLLALAVTGDTQASPAPLIDTPSGGP